MTEQTTEDLLASFQEQDRRIRFANFEHDDALAVGAHVIALARERSQSVSVAIWLGEQLVFHAALAGTTADNDGWMARKAATVRRYDAASQYVAKRWGSYGITEASARLGVDPMTYAFNGGAVPIRIGATQVGVAVASGMDDQVEHDLIIEALEAHLTAG